MPGGICHEVVHGIGCGVRLPDSRRTAGKSGANHYVDAFGVRFGMMIKTVTGVDLGGAATAPGGDGLALVKAGTRSSERFRFRCLLAPATYFLNAGVVGLVGEHEEYLAREMDVLRIRALPDPARLATGWVNLDVRPEFDRDA